MVPRAFEEPGCGFGVPNPGIEGREDRVCLGEALGILRGFENGDRLLDRVQVAGGAADLRSSPELADACTGDDPRVSELLGVGGPRRKDRKRTLQVPSILRGVPEANE